MSGSGDERTVIPQFRWLFVPFLFLAIGSTSALYFGTTYTEDDFAWTIEPALTAALLGAAYGSTIVFFALALMERIWVNFRMAIPAPFTLSTLMLGATLLHLDKFHLDSQFVPAAVAWIWLVVYIIVPPTIIVLTALQLRAPGVDPPRTRPLPVILRGFVLVYGVVSVIVGIVLFAVPDRLAEHWPWAITPLTGRAVAAWLAGLGVAALQATWENDLRRVRLGMGALLTVGALGLIAVGRYGDDVGSWWPGGWVLVTVLALMAAAGGYGLIHERQTA